MKMDPHTPKEVKAAADLFFETYNIIDSRMPQGSSVEDTIKIMEQVNKIASKLRNDKEKDERDARLGFYKEKAF